MTTENRFQERYRTNNIPWDLGKPDFNLVDTVEMGPIEACAALDIGCGTGDNAVWLAQKGFEVTGIDLSEIAIEKAKEKARRQNVKCALAVADFLKWEPGGQEFGFVFDRGCFHTCNSSDKRKQFAQNVAKYLAEDGIWLTIIGNADQQRGESGPPRRTAAEMTEAIEPYFEILSFSSGNFDSNSSDPARAWIGLMIKRS